MPRVLARNAIFALTVLATTPCPGQQALLKTPQPDISTQLVGSWRGTSTCMVKDSPCRDEIIVYRISAVAGKPRTFSVMGSKIVEGREVVMGTGEWMYDAASHALKFDSPHGKFVLFIRGDKMEGGLLREHPAIHAPIPCDPFDCTGPPDSDLYFRRIHLTKLH